MFGKFFNRYSREDIETDMDTVEQIADRDLMELEEADPELVTHLHNMYGEIVTRLYNAGYRTTSDHLWRKK